MAVNKPNQNSYGRRFLRKHGWRFISEKPNGHHWIIWWTHPDYGTYHQGTAITLQKTRNKYAVLKGERA